MRINGRTFYEILRDSRKQPIYLFHEKLSIGLHIEKKLRLANIHISGCIYEEKEDSSLGNVTSAYTILPVGKIDELHDVDPLIVYLGDDYDACYDTLTSHGYRPGSSFKWIKRYGWENLKQRYCYDPTLGFNSSCKDQGFPGYRIFGDSSDADATKIMIMGASHTESDLYLFESWPEHLFDECRRHGKKVCVYNGGVLGHTVTQELIKLLRDLPIIRPSLVVSLSGANNIHMHLNHPFTIDFCFKINELVADYPPTINMQKVLPFCGLETEKNMLDKPSYWLNYEYVMHEFCSVYGADFFGIFQPTLMSKRNKNTYEKEYLANRSFMGTYGLSVEKYTEIIDGFRARIAGCDYEWLHDFAGIYDEVDDPDIYIDGIHTTNHGNQIMAENVYRLIEDYL